jgi:hypothetical protein
VKKAKYCSSTESGSSTGCIGFGEEMCCSSCSYGGLDVRTHKTVYPNKQHAMNAMINGILLRTAIVLRMKDGLIILGDEVVKER